MAKANKRIRNATLGGISWWDYLQSIRPRGHRNEPQYLDYNDVKNKTGIVKITNKLIKVRKRLERKRSNYFKHMRQLTKPTKKTKQDMIKYGIDITKWWNEQHE